MQSSSRPEQLLTVRRPVACRGCELLINVGSEAVFCPRCKAHHHVDCWKEKGGCATRGCMQVAVLVRRESSPPRDDQARDRSARGRGVRIAVAACALLVLAVSGSYTFRQARALPATSVPTLRLMIWSSPASDDRLGASIERFSDERPDLVVRVETVPLGFPGAPAGDAAGAMLYEQKLVVTLAARAAPDVFALPENRLDVYAEGGALLPLDRFTDTGERVDEGGRVGGRLYALPNPIGEGWLAIWQGTTHPDAAWELLRHVALEFGSE